MARPLTSTMFPAIQTKPREDDCDIEVIEPVKPPKVSTKRGHGNFISPRLVGALDRWQLNIRDAVYVLQVTAEALGHNLDELVINGTSI